jgi:hypothetical protein
MPRVLLRDKKVFISGTIIANVYYSRSRLTGRIERKGRTTRGAKEELLYWFEETFYSNVVLNTILEMMFAIAPDFQRRQSV